MFTRVGDRYALVNGGDCERHGASAKRELSTDARPCARARYRLSGECVHVYVCVCVRVRARSPAGHHGASGVTNVTGDDRSPPCRPSGRGGTTAPAAGIRSISYGTTPTARESRRCPVDGRTGESGGSGGGLLRCSSN